MSLAENLLNNMENDFAEYLQEDLEPHIIIDESRIANVPQSLRTIAVTGDKDILTIPFDCARFIDGHDLSTFAIYLNYVLPDGTAGTYIPDSITTSDGDGEYHFDWLIKNNITKTNGKISFAITAIKTKQNDDGEPVVDKQWSSIPNGDCSIALGLDISNVPSEEESTDVVAQLSAILERIHGDVDEWIKTVIVQSTGDSTTQSMSQRAVTDKLGEKVDKSSIVQDIGNDTAKVMSQSSTTKHLNMVEDRANAYTDKKNSSNLEKISKNSKRITNTEEVLDVVLDETIEYSKNVPNDALPSAEVTKVGGMTYRDEETNTLKSAAVTKIIATGKNLFKVDTIKGNETNNGLTLKKVDGGGVSVSGTASALAQRMLYKINTNRLPNGYYFLSGKTNNIDVYAECRKNGNFIKSIFADSKIYVDNSQFDTLDICIQIKAGVTLNETVYPMLNYGDFFVMHEPYKESAIEIPKEVQNLDGYGLGISSDYCNHIDFNLDKYRQKVKKYVCQGGSNLSMGFIRESKVNPYRCFVISEPLYGRMYGTPYVVSAPFTKGSQSAVFEGVSGSYHIAPYDLDAMAETSFYVSFSCEDLGVPENADETSLKNAAKALLKNLYDQGTPLTVVYALRTPIETDIADTLTDDNFIEVSEGGLVIAENKNGLASPTTIIYRKDNTVKKENDGSIYVGNIRLSPSDLSKLLGLIN